MIVFFYLFSHYEFKLNLSVLATQDVGENKQDVGDQLCAKYQIYFPRMSSFFVSAPTQSEIWLKCDRRGGGCVDILNSNLLNRPPKNVLFPAIYLVQKSAPSEGGTFIREVFVLLFMCRNITRDEGAGCTLFGR